MTQEAASANAWRALREARVSLLGLDREAVPVNPGILVLYRDTRVAWVGKSVNLRRTIANAFAVEGPSATSPLRRSVLSTLGIATIEALNARRYRLTPDDHARISGWIRACAVAWQVCESEADVVKLETQLQAEPDRQA